MFCLACKSSGFPINTFGSIWVLPEMCLIWDLFWRNRKGWSDGREIIVKGGRLMLIKSFLACLIYFLYLFPLFATVAKRITAIFHGLLCADSDEQRKFHLAT